MWTFSRRLLSRNRSVRSMLLQQNGGIVGCFNSRPCFARGKQDSTNNESFKVSRLFEPSTAKGSSDAELGIELTGKVNKSDILKVLNKFSQKKENRALCLDHGLDDYIQEKSFASFRQFCFQTETIPAELYVKLYDIINGAAHPDDLFPYFLNHAKEIFPHLSCMNDLKQISDLTNPSTWYPQARSKIRKIIFHAGPTNSGKTYRAMQRFLEARSGIYCGPLKLLAMEVFQKSNEKGTPCDLVTGEEKRCGNVDGSAANHVAITIEMAPVDRRFDVAIIDEIQLLKDPSRGWAWTRAFLGLNADEIHVCGEAGTKELLERMCLTTGELIEYNHYERLTKLTVEDKPLESFEALQPGDCIVCFNKNDIYTVSREIEILGKEVAVIYGSLPPNTKLAQAAKFNDPNNSCKIMVATDAIGMGLNLSIRRIIFYSVVKLQQNENGEKEISSLSVSQALQIAGRAGRFGTQWEHGYVTTFKRTDLPTLKYLLSEKPEPIVQAGLHPTADQIELYAYHLPNSSLTNLLEIFTSLSTVNDDLYFMCNTEDFKELANMIHHISLPLRVRYVYCCAPVNRKQQFVCALFSKFANQHSKYQAITYDFVAKHCALPVRLPQSISDLVQLENIFDVMDIYLWLSYRFVDMFPHGDKIRSAQAQLDDLIQQGVAQITRLIKESNATADIPEQYQEIKAVASIEEYNNAERLDTDNKERFSDYLIRKGVLSPKMLHRLQIEFLEGPSSDGSFSSNNSNSNVTSQRKSKKRSKTRK